MDESVIKHLELDRERQTLDEVSETLLRAAQYIECFGWCQGQAFAPNGVCMFGALHRVADYKLVKAAEMRITSSLGGWMGCWNDAPGRTKEEVIAKLRSVALGG